MLRCLIFALLILGVPGCAGSRSFTTPNREAIAESSPTSQLVRGRPILWLDRTGWVIGIPNKLAYWNQAADNHQVSSRTEESVLAYLQHEELDSVLVRVNQYDPCGEWRRLASNQKVGAGWRYTIGTLHLIKYTCLPGRLVGGDSYNPYTDSLYIYSDLPPLALVEAAYAKDVHARGDPGSYAATQELPVIGMWHKTIATRNVLAYIRSEADKPDQQDSYQILYAGYGADWGGQVASFLPYGHLFGRLGGALVGHTANGVRSLVTRDVEPSLAKPDPMPEVLPASGGMSDSLLTDDHQ